MSTATTQNAYSNWKLSISARRPFFKGCPPLPLSLLRHPTYGASPPPPVNEEINLMEADCRGGAIRTWLKIPKESPTSIYVGSRIPISLHTTIIDQILRPVYSPWPTPPSSSKLPPDSCERSEAYLRAILLSLNQYIVPDEYPTAPRCGMVPPGSPRPRALCKRVC